MYLFSQCFSRFQSVFTLMVCLGLSIAGQSFAGAGEDGLFQKAKVSFEKNFPQIKVSKVERSPFPGLFQMTLDNGEIVIGPEAMDHIIVNAKVLQVNGPGQVVDLMEEAKAKSRIETLKNLKDDEHVVFKGEGQNVTPIYVFTDVDCGYCRKLHQEMAELNKSGVEVHYLAWPRAGIDSDSGTKMHNIWCAEDQQAAMTLAKNGGVPEDGKKDCTSPIQSQLSLGFKMGVQGTPAIFTQDGRQIGGYAPAAEIVRMLEMPAAK